MLKLDEDGDLEVTRKVPSCDLKSEEEKKESASDQIIHSASREETLITSELGHQLAPNTVNKQGVSNVCINPTSGPQLNISLSHRLHTQLKTVGLQVWNGAALLVDYLCHIHQPLLSTDTTVLELGSGVGLVGIALGCLGAQCILTEAQQQEVLFNCQHNVAANAHFYKTQPLVREVDWLNPPTWLYTSPGPNTTNNHGDDRNTSTTASNTTNTSFEWTTDDIKLLTRVEYIVAADVVYDNDLTEAFMRVATLLAQYIIKKTRHLKQQRRLPPKLIIALEKRPVFTIKDMCVTCPAYDYFRSLFTHIDSGGTSSSSYCKQPEQHQCCDNSGGGGEGCLLWKGRQLDIASLPQCVQGYERSDLMEIWELEYCATK